MPRSTLLHQIPLAPLAACLLLAGCATKPPPPGASQDEVLRAWGPPTAAYALPEGAQRLEYATGPYGRTTWMVDLDAGGRVTQSRQVLGEAEFLRLQQAGQISRDELRLWLGTPGEHQGIWRGGEVWSWRYPTNDCLWFRVQMDAGGRVEGSGYSPDPRCDAPSNTRRR